LWTQRCPTLLEILAIVLLAAGVTMAAEGAH
jgi:hypothetical protein